MSTRWSPKKLSKAIAKEEGGFDVMHLAVSLTIAYGDKLTEFWDHLERQLYKSAEGDSKATKFVKRVGVPILTKALYDDLDGQQTESPNADRARFMIAKAAREACTLTLLDPELITAIRDSKALSTDSKSLVLADLAESGMQGSKQAKKALDSIAFAEPQMPDRERATRALADEYAGRVPDRNDEVPATTQLGF